MTKSIRERKVRRLQNNQTKSQVHQLILRDAQTYLGRSRVPLRLLTLPGLTWGFEDSILRLLGKRVDAIVGLEANEAIYRKARPKVQELRREYGNTAIHWLNSTDYRYFDSPCNGGGNQSFEHRNTGFKHGFDIVWLDWMGHWCSSIRNNLSAMACNINIFRRAWDRQQPGLLYITLSVGREKLADMEILSRALLEFGLDHDPEAIDTEAQYARRFKGVTAYLNSITRLHGAECEPRHSFIYQEPSDSGYKRQTMMLIGYDVHQIFPEKENRDETGGIINLANPVRGITQ